MFRLCLKLGYPHPDILLDQLTSNQISEWEAYDKLDPIGEWREDYRMAVLDSLIVNIVSRLYAKKGHTPKEITPTEFMPNWSGEKKIAKRQSIEDMKTVLLGLAKSQNAVMAKKAKMSTNPPPSLKKGAAPRKRPSRQTNKDK